MSERKVDENTTQSVDEGAAEEEEELPDVSAEGNEHEDYHTHSLQEEPQELSEVSTEANDCDENSTQSIDEGEEELSDFSTEANEHGQYQTYLPYEGREELLHAPTHWTQRYIDAARRFRNPPHLIAHIYENIERLRWNGHYVSKSIMTYRSLLKGNYNHEFVDSSTHAFDPAAFNNKCVTLRGQMDAALGECYEQMQDIDDWVSDKLYIAFSFPEADHLNEWWTRIKSDELPNLIADYHELGFPSLADIALKAQRQGFEIEQVPSSDIIVGMRQLPANFEQSWREKMDKLAVELEEQLDLPLLSRELDFGPSFHCARALDYGGKRISVCEDRSRLQFGATMDEYKDELWDSSYQLRKKRDDAWRVELHPDGVVRPKPRPSIHEALLRARYNRV